MSPCWLPVRRNIASFSPGCLKGFELRVLGEEQMRLRASITLFLGLSVLAGTSWAQAIGSITGVVQDATQARVPGVTVTATNTATGVKTQLITNESGAY